MTFWTYYPKVPLANLTYTNSKYLIDENIPVLVVEAIQHNLCRWVDRSSNLKTIHSQNKHCIIGFLQILIDAMKNCQIKQGTHGIALLALTGALSVTMVGCESITSIPSVPLGVFPSICASKNSVFMWFISWRGRGIKDITIAESKTLQTQPPNISPNYFGLRNGSDMSQKNFAQYGGKKLQSPCLLS